MKRQVTLFMSKEERGVGVQLEFKAKEHVATLEFKHEL